MAESKWNIKAKMKVFGIFAGMMTLVSALFLWLIFSNFKTNYKQISTQYYELVTNQVITKLEDNIRYGKKLTNYYGMDTILGELSGNLPEELASYIVGPNGELLYSETDAAPLTAEISAALRGGIMNDAAAGGLVYREYEDRNLFLWRVQDSSGELAGGLVHVQNTDSLNAFFSYQWNELLIDALLIFAGTLVLMLIAILAIPQKKEQQNRLGIRVCVTCVILAVMLTGLMGYQQIRREYKNTMQTCGEGIASYIGTTIKSVHDKGVAYEEMRGLSKYLSGNIKNTALLWNMSLMVEVAGTDELLMRESQTTVYIPIEAEGERTGYMLCFELSSEYMNQMLAQLFLTFALTVLVMFVICGEVSRLPQIWMSPVQEEDAVALDHKRETQLRMMSFLIFMANYIALPYSAAMIREQGATLFGMTTAASASMPLTFEIGAMLLGLLIFPKLLRKQKNGLLIIGGILLLVAGNISALLAVDAQILLVSRMVCGLGLALVKLFGNRDSVLGSAGAVQNNVGAINIGVLGGITCGGSIGAIIAENLGTRYTFLCAAGLFVFTGVMLLFMFRGDYSRHDESQSEKSALLQLLKSPKTLLYILAVILPLNLGLMFIVSFAPAFVTQTGSSGLLTSYAFMLNGLAGIYIGGALNRFAARRFSSRIAVFIMMLIGIAAVFTLGSPLVIIAAVLMSSALFGLFDVYGNPVAAKGFLELPSVQTLPPAAALTALGVLGSLIQLAAPTVYSVLLSNMDVNAPMAVLWPVIMVLAVCAVIAFLLMNSKSHRKELMQ